MSSYAGDLSTLILFSKPNLLTLHLVDFLLTKSCVVKIYSTDSKQWLEKTNHLVENPNFNVYDLEKHFPDGADYVLTIAGLASDETLTKQKEIEFIKVNKFVLKTQVKSFLLVPFVLLNSSQEKLSKLAQKHLSENSNTIFMGDLYGPRMSFSSSSVSQLFKSTISGVPAVTYDKSALIYPVYVGDVVRVLTTAIFSYGFSNKKVVLANRLPFSAFYQRLKRVGMATSYVANKLTTKSLIANCKHFIDIKDQKLSGVKLTIDWLKSQKFLFEETIEETLIAPREPLFQLPEFSVNKAFARMYNFYFPEINDPSPAISKPKTRGKRNSFSIPKISIKNTLIKKISFDNFNLSFSGVVRKSYYLISLMVLLLITPIILLLISTSTLSVTLNKIDNKKSGNIENFLTLSKSSAVTSKNLAYSFSSLPLLATIYGPVADTASIVEIVNQSIVDSLAITKLSEELIVNVLNEEGYDLEELSRLLYVDLDSLYKKTSFLQTQLDDFGFVNKKLVSRLQNFKETRKNLATFRDISANLEDILGRQEQKTYLVLFQNNLELRPTGGFISALALVTFDNGKLIDVNVMDIYTIDNQLKGSIEPPYQIKYYLGEENWFLRDSNWDPDFPTSAARAEWFLEKEIDRSVDGVIALDLEAIRSLLSELGPIYLSDLETQIDSKNLYERVVFENKANFYSSVLTSITELITEAPVDKYSLITNSLIKSFENKHILAFVHDKQVMANLSFLGWDGAVEIPECSGNCVTNFLGTVEANLGVNKANYFIEKDTSLVTLAQSDKITNTLTVNINNQAASQTGISGRYKSFFRVIVPTDAQFDQIVLSNARGSEKIDPIIEVISGRKEAGILIEVSPQERQQIVFKWSLPADLDYSSPGQLDIVWRKQPGTNEEKISLETSIPNRDSLTQKVLSSYNMNLSEDFETSLQW